MQSFKKSISWYLEYQMFLQEYLDIFNTLNSNQANLAMKDINTVNKT